MHALALVLWFVATPPAPCRVDADCTLSTFAGCCPTCCRSAPHAVARGTNEGARCSAVRCSAPDCGAVKCAQQPAAGQFVAACRAGRCVAVPRPACRVDADCTVVAVTPPAGAACHASPCGCCPVNTAIVRSSFLLDEADERSRSTTTNAPKTPAPPKPATATTEVVLPLGPPAPVACSPCPAPPPAKAMCVARACVLRER